ncbi:MAG TPA: 50S ribosomal protein L39e [Candidatus Nanoarchaeia archaeon]|nr:50S ribosomal protein L39e [Candidatus Nanoarchaeia archaeon]
MTSRKPAARKKRLNKANKSRIAGPIWAILRKFGKTKTHRWRLNPHKRRNWRANKLKK